MFQSAHYQFYQNVIVRSIKIFFLEVQGYIFKMLVLPEHKVMQYAINKDLTENV